jgi:inorganic pyrophosphatase
MTPYAKLSAFDASGQVQAVVDTPKGSNAKYKLDEATGLFKLGKCLPAGAVFPGNFGFIPGTKGGDGDPLDVLILMDTPVLPGIVVPVCPIGVLKAEQTETDGRVVRNDRLIAVLETPYNPPEFTELSALHPRRLDEIAHFFKSYNAIEGRVFRSLGRDGAQAAMAIVRSSLR